MTEKPVALPSSPAPTPNVLRAMAIDVVDAIEWLDQGEPKCARDVLEEIRDKLRTFGESVPSTPSPTPLNLNDTVFVRLTLQGEEVEREWYRQLKLDSGKHIRPAKNGWRQFQLHDLMNLFGQEMYIGNTAQMFRDNEIRFGVPSTPVETAPCDKFMVKVGAGPGGLYCNRPRNHEGQCARTFITQTADPEVFPEVKSVEFSTPHDAQLAKKLCQELQAFDLNRIKELESQLTQVRSELVRLKSGISKIAWDRQEGFPDVPVLQPRYDALKAELTQVREELAFERHVSEHWHTRSSRAEGHLCKAQESVGKAEAENKQLKQSNQLLAATVESMHFSLTGESCRKSDQEQASEGVVDPEAPISGDGLENTRALHSSTSTTRKSDSETKG